MKTVCTTLATPSEVIILASETDTDVIDHLDRVVRKFNRGNYGRLKLEKVTTF